MRSALRAERFLSSKGFCVVHGHVARGIILPIYNVMFNGELGKILVRKNNRSKC